MSCNKIRNIKTNTKKNDNKKTLIIKVRGAATRLKGFMVPARVQSFSWQRRQQ